MKRFRFLVGAAVVAAALVYLFVSGFRQSAASQVTLATLMERVRRGELHGENVQLGGGTVEPGSIVWGEYRSRPEFVITDGQHRLRARYTGHAILPDTFQDRAPVVLEGQYDPVAGVFQARVVLAKCPSKYEGESYEGHVRAADSG